MFSFVVHASMNVVSIAVKRNDVGGFFLLHIFFFCSHHFLFSPFEPLMKKGLHSLYLYFSLNIQVKCVKSFDIYCYVQSER